MSVIGRTHSLVAKSLQVLEQSDQLMAFSKLPVKCSAIDLRITRTLTQNGCPLVTHLRT